MDLLTALRDHLIAESIGRDPRTAGVLPPIWREPRDGVPAPGEGDNATERGAEAVLGLYLSGGIPSRPYESEVRDDTVDVWIRATRAPTTFALEEQLRASLIDKRDWQLAPGFHLLECEQWTPLQRLWSDEQGYTHRCSFLFQRRA